MQDLEHTGCNTLLPGSYGFTVYCPTYLRALDTQGWTVTHESNGNIAGTILLVSTLCF